MLTSAQQATLALCLILANLGKPEALMWCCRHFDVSTTGQLEEVKEGLALAFLEKMVSRDQLWITATVCLLHLMCRCN